MRVYVPTTPARLAGLREDGLPAGTEGYAVTDALADALGLPRPAGPAARGQVADVADPADGADEAAEDLLQVVLDAAAEASLLLLADDGPGPARRAVVVVEARARPVDDDTHPATVVLTAPLRWSAVDCVLADDETAADRVGRAAELAGTDQDRAVERLERDQLGWFGPEEL